MCDVDGMIDLEVNVFTSSNKDAEIAGKEIANAISKKLKQKPNFAMLFCTGHYEENNGLRKILDSVYASLPANTPFIGGNIAGFVTRTGCYARGAVVLTVSYPNMNISIGIGKNTKRNPKKAARQCSAMIKKGLKGNYKTKIIFSFVSGAEMPHIPGLSDATNIKSKLFARLMVSMFSFAQKTAQKGFGGEQEVLEEITRELPDFNLIHGSAMNSYTLENNYQFFNKEILTERVVCLAIETDLNLDLKSAHRGEETNINFKITDISKDRLFIKKINDKPALPEFLRLMNWTKESFEKEKLIDIIGRYPLTFEKNGKIFLRPIGAFIGDYIGAMARLEKDEIFITKISEHDIINSIDEITVRDNPQFGYMVSCIGRQGILGLKIFQSQEKIKNYFKDKEFLLIYTAAEGIKRPSEDLEYFNLTITSAIFSK
jgi:hypothetical protein